MAPDEFANSIGPIMARKAQSGRLVGKFVRRGAWGTSCWVGPNSRFEASERLIKQSRVTSPCVRPGLGPFRGRTVLDNLQTALAFVVLLGVVLVYRGFLGSLLGFLADHPSQVAILVVLYAIVYGQFGNALGVPYLFWNEEPVTRLLAAVEATLLLAIVGITAYFSLDEEEHRVGMQRVADFL